MGRRRVLESYYPRLAKINALEPSLMQLSDEELKSKTSEFKLRLNSGENEDRLLEEAFAVVREASRRVLGMRHFDCQLLGGMVLHEGQVAEMSTGEGKTLVATLPVYLNALRGSMDYLANPSWPKDTLANQGPSGQAHVRGGGVHVVTVNDYLAKRDAGSMGKVYRFLGLSCSAVQSNMSSKECKEAFAADVVYITGQELGFAYLRDNTAPHAQDLCLPHRLNFAVIDEADSVLIDESLNPMIISTRIEQDERPIRLVDEAVGSLYREIMDQVDQVARSYLRPPDEKTRLGIAKRMKSKFYICEEKQKSCYFTPFGLKEVLDRLVKAGAQLKPHSPPSGPTSTDATAIDPDATAATVMDLWESPVPWGQLAMTSLKAYEYYNEGKQYIVRGGEVVIVDEATGRLRPITRWQGGVHQAVEAKEKVAIKEDTTPTASITFQVFFKQYQKLSGMTGTARPAAAEFYELYELKLVQVPTHRPNDRKDMPSRLYFDAASKLSYLKRTVKTCWVQGRPVLIGTTSVQESEAVLSALTRPDDFYESYGYGYDEEDKLAIQRGLRSIQILNAKPDKVRVESEIIAQAGLPGSVTIATNMAGRGTDIILGGNSQGLTRLALMRVVYRRLLGDADEARSVPTFPLDEIAPYDARPTQMMSQQQGQGQQGATIDIFPDRKKKNRGGGLSPIDPWTKDLDFDTDSNSDISPKWDDPLSTFPSASHLDSIPPELQLPRDLRTALASSVVLAASHRSTALTPTLSLTSPSLYTYAQVNEMMDWVMDRADALKKKVMSLLKSKYSRDGQDDSFSLTGLEFTICVAPAVDQVLRNERSAGGGGDGDGGGEVGGDVSKGIGQATVLRTALLLWLWLDVKCSSLALHVREKGGLLVVGTSMQESQRVELQLCGRAGRQGDPGQTLMIYDIADPLMIVHGGEWMGTLSEMMSKMDAEANSAARARGQATLPPIYLEGKMVDTTVGGMRKSLECLNQMSRLEMKKFDEVIETYRRNMYSMRRLILLGTSYQSRQIIYIFIQLWADRLVSDLLDDPPPSSTQLQRGLFGGSVDLKGGVRRGKASPKNWSTPSLPLITDYPPLPTTGQEGPPPNTTARLLSPMEMLLRSCFLLVNPEGLIKGPEFEFVGAGLSAEELRQMSPVAKKTLDFFFGSRPGSGLAMGENLLDEVQVMSEGEVRDLLSFALGNRPDLPLPSPTPTYSSGAEPDNGSEGGGLRRSIALATHSILFGWSQGGDQCGGLPSSLASRPEIRTRDPLMASRVRSIRDHLGWILIRSFEERRRGLKAASLASVSTRGAGFMPRSESEVESWLCECEKDLMLQWSDVCWSCFLEEVDKVKKATFLRAGAHSDPLTEFKLEANRTFLGTLDCYRDSVVEAVMAHRPQI